MDVTTSQFLFAWVLAGGAAIGVFLHANRHGVRHPTAWGAGVFLVLAIALPLYVIHYRRQRGSSQG